MDFPTFELGTFSSNVNKWLNLKKKLINDLFIVKCRNASEGKNCARAKNKLIEKRQLSNTKGQSIQLYFWEFIKESVEVIRIMQKEQKKSKWLVLLLCKRHFKPVQKLKGNLGFIHGLSYKFFQTIFQLKNGSVFVLVAPLRAAHQAL